MNIGHVQNYKIINCSWKINVLVLIRVYWWENWSEINKRTGTFIRNSRVQCPDRESLAGSVIVAIWTVEFENGLRMGVLPGGY